MVLVHEGVAELWWLVLLGLTVATVLVGVQVMVVVLMLVAMASLKVSRDITRP